MGKGTEAIILEITQDFPKLKHDKGFLISSNADSHYNCIAWACFYQDRWIQPPYLGRPNLDCVVWWPPSVPTGLDPDNLIELFKSKGYEICNSFIHEPGYRKVALYKSESTNLWTHASRELTNGFWSSKLGNSNDIQHSTPLELENDIYGKVYCYMKKEVN